MDRTGPGVHRRHGSSPEARCWRLVDAAQSRLPLRLGRRKRALPVDYCPSPNPNAALNKKHRTIAWQAASTKLMNAMRWWSAPAVPVSAAVTAGHRGLNVLIVEKEPRFGGTTARP